MPGGPFGLAADLGNAGETFAFKPGTRAADIDVNGVRRDGGGRVSLRIYRSLKPIVAALNGAAVATVMAGFDGHRGWLYYIGVLPDWRGRGFGRQLVEASCEWLRARGCPKVELMVREGNPAAGLYEQREWELQPVRTYGRWLDA